MRRTSDVERLVAAACGALVVAAAARPAAATSGLDSPDVGVLQIGRGGAWVARADDPLAAYMNPAALSTQSMLGVHAGAHLMLMNQCFTRRGPGNTPVPPSASAGSTIPAPGTPGGPDAAVCAEGGVFFNPQIALSVRPIDRVAVGLALLGPHGDGSQTWPESVVEASGQTQPAPQRYLLVSSDALILLPTLSVSVRVLPWLSLGAGFIWGVASVDVVNFSEGTSAPGGDDFNAHQDLKSRLRGTDGFVPGVVVGGLAAPTDWLDVGVWFKAQDAVRTRTHLTIESRYWQPSGRKNEDPCASEAAGCNITDDEDAGSFKLAIPMEAKLGFRYHHARGVSTWSENQTRERPRDPMSEDLFDIELDLTWANNSAADTIEVRFDEGIQVRGTDVGFVPRNADVPHGWRDVFGVRLGGDFNVLPNLLALRAGGFMETKGQDDAYLNLDFHLGWRAGVSGGATVRLGPVDLSAAYQHTFYGALDNGGEGQVRAVSGDVATGNRSVQAVNGGRLESSLNEVGLSATLRL